MAHVVLTAPFDAEFPELDGEVPAATLFDLVRRLDARAPGFAQAAEERALFAANGVAVADWSAALPEDAEVLVIARIAGGEEGRCEGLTPLALPGMHCAGT